MKVLANDGLAASGVKALEAAGFNVDLTTVAQDQLVDFINENEIVVILVRSATQVRKDIIDNCPSLKIIGRGGVGMDNIDVEYAREQGLSVINTPAASSHSVAELVMVLEGHTLSTSEGKHLSKIVPVSRDKEHPLSFSQRRLWDWQQLAGESAT